MIDYTKIDTTINIGGVAIHQPITSFTDIVFSGFFFFFYLNLKKVSIQRKGNSEWQMFYLMLAIASFLGGCSHGFFAVHEGVGYKSFWLPMQLFNIFSAFYAQKATLSSALQYSRNKNRWNRSFYIQVVLFSIAVFVFHNFLVVVIDSAIALIPVMIIHFKDSEKEKNSKWIAWGIVILFCAAIINVTKLSINEYFTHLEFSHIFLFASLFVMFIGIRRKAIY